mgnify:CR=1 FL=1
MVALYSIKPIYSNQIITGTKKYEIRKKIPAKIPDYIVIYSSSPESRVIGYAEVKNILERSVARLWEEVAGHAGITRKAYEEYFSGRSVGYAIELGNVKRFIRPFKLGEISASCVPPQSFSYISKQDFNRIKRRKTQDV